MSDRRQIRSANSDKGTWDEILVSSNLNRYKCDLKGIGISSVENLITMPGEKLLQISTKLSRMDKIKFEKSISEVRECFGSGDEELKKALDFMLEPELYSLFSAYKVGLNNLSESKLISLGLQEFQAKFLIMNLKAAHKIYSKSNIGSDVIGNQKINPSYADVIKSEKCDISQWKEDSQPSRSYFNSSTTAIKLSASPIEHSKVKDPAKVERIGVDAKIEIQQNETKRISAEQLLKNLGLKTTILSAHDEYAKVIADMEQSEQVKLACIAIDLIVKTNSGTIETTFDESHDLALTQHSNDVEMLDLDKQMPNQQPENIEEKIIPPAKVATVETVKVIRPMPRKALNILLLGQTGVGKSTFINAFCNYISHETLSEAKNNMIPLIPSSFSVSDDDYVDHHVIIGNQNEQNECLSKLGQSSTQSCRSYVFPSKHGAIRLIDTPGVGDTRGQDQDLLNFNNILSYISQYTELNAICILLTPNNARLTAGFRLCLIQLLNNLEKSASQNIIFVFTNARSTFYQPGDTKPILEELLREIAREPPYVTLRFDQTTSYCVDNESFRFLAAITNGLDFLNSAAVTFEESWTTSVTECTRLINYILTLKPHNIQGTVSISQARRLINDLSGPVADIILEICANMTNIDEQKVFLEKNRNSNESLEFLKSKLKTKVLEISYENLPYPTTICVSKKCLVISDNDVNYPQVCHENCYLTLPTPERCGDPNIIHCMIFSKIGSYRADSHCVCRICGCSWKDHMRITRIKKLHEVEKEDKGIKILLQKVTTLNEAIEVLDQQLESYKIERQILVDIMAFFTAFQNLNSITGRGDLFRDILMDNLRTENYKNTLAHANNHEVIEKLKNVLQNYDEIKNKLADGNHSKQSMHMTAENVFQYEQKLYELPLNGSKLRALKSSAVNYDFDGTAEIVVEPKTDLSTTTILQSVDAYFLKH